MEIMFNELSLSPVDDKNKAREMMEIFVRASVFASKNGLSNIRWDEESFKGFYMISLSQNYLLTQWLADPEVNSDIKNKFRDLSLTFPLITKELIKELQEYENSDMNFNVNAEVKNVKGLLATYIMDSMATSFLSNSLWDTSRVNAEYLWIDGNNKLQRKPVTINHFASKDQFSAHLEWIRQKHKEALEKGKEVWQQRTMLFPELVFCGETENQLTKQGISKSLSIAIDKLLELSKATKEWKKSNSDFLSIIAKYPITITDESERTMDVYGNQRRFKLPNGAKDYFRLHIKLASGLRIHIYPDNSERVVYIGYIGKHLDTVSG